MLARVDAVEGVGESRVDWSGRYFLVRLAPAADADAVAARVTEALGKARRIEAAAETEQIAAYRRGEPWMRSGETLRLSRQEARVLAARFGEKAAEQAHLNEDQARRLAGLAEEELIAAFTRIQGEEKGLEARFRAEWPGVVTRIGERSRDFASEEQSKSVMRTLEHAFDRPK